jgi:hypothetical protein
MPRNFVYLMCQILLALVLLSSCRPVYYGATSIVAFEDNEKNAFVGRGFKVVMSRLGEPTDIILDKSGSMTWIYEVDEASSNPLQALSSLAVGLPLKRKILMLKFDSNRRVISSHIERSKTNVVGLIGRVNHRLKQLEAKKRVKSVLDQLNLLNSGTRK